MFTYKCKHLNTGVTFDRPSALLYKGNKDRRWRHEIDMAIIDFHMSLPEHAETPLVPLPEVAKELGFSHVFMKDESRRLGLPSFKILGASWAIHKAICTQRGLALTTSLTELRTMLQIEPVHLITCSDGNWGRAVARMASHLRVPATIFIPKNVGETTQRLINHEGHWDTSREIVKVLNGSYDECVVAARHEADSTNGLLVMDTSWPGYEDIPQWVTDGYSTMLSETDSQVAEATSGQSANVTLASVGVGSWAQAVVAHYMAENPANRIVTVEPDTAASFKESLHIGEATPIVTGDTIMCGMNCGTSSMIAWPVLRDGVHAAVVVTDQEAHECVQRLKTMGVSAGPCGAATLRGLERLVAETYVEDRANTNVVLFSTEGTRDYKVPEGCT